MDLHTNPQVMDVMKKRIQIIDAMRDYLRDKGYMIETPMLQALTAVPARPFKTYNATDLPLTMRIAPSLSQAPARRRIGFEISRNFRNEGISPAITPSSPCSRPTTPTATGSMADLVEHGLHRRGGHHGTLKIKHKDEEGNVTIDLTRPWRRVSMVDLVEERGLEVRERDTGRDRQAP